MTVLFACTLRDRLRGLLFREPDNGLDGGLDDGSGNGLDDGLGGGVCVLAPCRDVHTYGMRHPLDIAFVSREGVVIESYRCIGPRCRKRVRRAYAVLERFSRDTPWFERGDRITLQIRKREHERT